MGPRELAGTTPVADGNSIVPFETASSHAIAWVVANAPSMDPRQIILVNLSGRGDKDINTIAKIDNITLT